MKGDSKLEAEMMRENYGKDLKGCSKVLIAVCAVVGIIIAVVLIIV